MVRLRPPRCRERRECVPRPLDEQARHPADTGVDHRMVLRSPGLVPRSPMSNPEHEFADTNRHLVEVPDSFAIARWPRDADVTTIARCILGTLKYEPHTADTTALQRALEGVINSKMAA